MLNYILQFLISNLTSCLRKNRAAINRKTLKIMHGWWHIHAKFGAFSLKSTILLGYLYLLKQNGRTCQDFTKKLYNGIVICIMLEVLRGSFRSGKFVLLFTNIPNFWAKIEENRISKFFCQKNIIFRKNYSTFVLLLFVGRSHQDFVKVNFNASHNFLSIHSSSLWSLEK